MNRLIVCAALMIGIAGPAAAHKGHVGLTVVRIDATSGAVRVEHRFAAHDVEPALVSIAPEAQPSLDDAGAVAALEDHVGQRFRLDIDGAAVALTRTETRLAGDNVRIDFAGETEDHSIEAVTVDLDFFPDVRDDKAQQVNIRIGTHTRTLVFRPGDRARTARFD